jgi:hypothetical protein
LTNNPNWFINKPGNFQFPGFSISDEGGEVFGRSSPPPFLAIGVFIMKKIRILYIDRKGETGSFQLPVKDTEVEAEILALTSLSHIGTDGYSETVITEFAAPQSVNVTDDVENDRDFKCVCGFKGASGYFKISWPAPKINIEGGFVINWGTERAEVPAVSAATGNDGTEVAALVATATGDSTVTFRYGRLSKRS